MNKIFEADRAMRRKIEKFYPVSDMEYEVLAKQVARNYNVSWRWSEDRYSIEFFSKEN